MNNLKLSVKLIGGFLIVAGITLAVGWMGWRGVSQTGQSLKETHNSLRAVEGLLGLNELQASIQKTERSLLIPEFIGNEKEKAHQMKNLAKYWNEVNEHWKVYESASRSKEEEATWNNFKTAWEAWKKDHSQFMELIRAGKRKEALDLSNGKERGSLNAAEKALTDITDYNIKEAEETEKSAEAQADSTKLISIVGMVVGLVVALGVGIFLTISITRPISRVVEGLTDGSEQVASASSQVSSASQSLAEGASEQAAGLEETSSSIEEMASMTRKNAESANEANTLMAETSRVVDEANHSMIELTESMKEISAASEETAKIIKTIDEIAFQTNLLALNAAVEAARAGEAGAGFAVVADEVRNLAMRAADAAKNTANLIEGTVKKIKNGSDTVARTNEAFGKVATGAKKVGELVGEISAASNEQAQGVDQINKAVAEMDKVVQKNAASAEESASASEEMNAQAEQMKGYVAELVAVVGGNRNGNRLASAKEFAYKAEKGGQAAMPKGHWKTGMGKVLPTPAKKEREKGLEATLHEPKEVRPEQVIPMGEGDFKEF